MDPRITSAAAAVVVPRIIASFRLRWLVYGAAIYYGLRYMNRRGILPDQTNAALNLIDHGIDVAKSKVGLGESGSLPSTHH